MPSLKQHCAISFKRTRFDFKGLHEWIDAPKDELEYNHRIRRHLYNEKQKDKIWKYWEAKKGKGWGQKAVVEWLFHIALDHLSTAFKESYSIYGERSFNYQAFGLSKTGYIHIDHEAYTEFGLQDYFDSLKRSPLQNILHDILNFLIRRRKFI